MRIATVLIAANTVLAKATLPVFSQDELDELLNGLIDSLEGLSAEATIEEIKATADEMFGADPSDLEFSTIDTIKPAIVSSTLD